MVVRKSAIIMSNAMIKNDLETLADYTHPKILAAMGGKDKMIARTKASIAEMKTGGVTFRGASIGKIGRFYTSGKDLYCLIPHEILMNTEGGYLSSTSSVLGISHDKGKTWKFVSAGNIGKKRLKTIFTTLPDGLQISPQTTPVFHKE
ncbi:hypothetical protein Phep_1087 [Pedobacter heparinus DSM 2366]|uniref:Uncharacterized protein n=2 Tax=Pedobacter heparinus TaxID=984 RepID=C6Y3M6_PEDHD|nr:hypothetical protein Phep_1087 [Pedobacter heparinus DSM 2366]